MIIIYIYFIKISKKRRQFLESGSLSHLDWSPSQEQNSRRYMDFLQRTIVSIEKTIFGERKFLQRPYKIVAKVIFLAIKKNLPRLMFPDLTFAATLRRYTLDIKAKLRPIIRFLWRKLSSVNVVFVVVEGEQNNS